MLLDFASARDALARDEVNLVTTWNGSQLESHRISFHVLLS